MLSWYGIPDELDQDMKDFMSKYQISFSSGYIGMLRIYWKRKDGTTGIAETSRFAPILAVMAYGPPQFPSDQSLRESGIKFVRRLMSLTPKRVEEILNSDEVPNEFADSSE